MCASQIQILDCGNTCHQILRQPAGTTFRIPYIFIHIFMNDCDKALSLSDISQRGHASLHVA